MEKFIFIPALFGALLLSSQQARGEQTFSGDILIGVSATSGNSDTNSFFVRGEALLSDVIVDDKADPLSMKAEFLRSEDDGVVSSRRGQGELRYDREIRNKTSFFFLERVSFDDFQNLDLRAEEQLGLAQKFVVQPKYWLGGDLGLSRIDSFYETAPNEGEFGIVVGGHAWWNIYGPVQLTEDVSYRPAFSDFNDYLFTSETGVTTKLSDNWKVKLIYQIFYDNTPPAGTKSTDKNLMLTLGYSF